MTRVKPLCLSFWTPPVVRPQAILIGKMVPEWIAHGLVPVVIGYKGNSHWPIKAPVHRIPQFTPSRILCWLSALHRLLEKRYYERLFEIARAIIEKHGLNLVFSFSNPQPSNILGAMLQERLGIRFVSHFSDPFYDNPLKSFKGKVAKEALKKERYIVEHSDRVVFVNDDLAELVMRKYSAQERRKLVVIPHCFDPRLYPQKKSNKVNNTFVLSHIGTFYKKRSPEILFRALSSFKAKHYALAKNLRVRLVGAAMGHGHYSNVQLSSLIRKFDLDNMVSILPVIDYTQSLRLMVESDCLLVIDGNIEKSPFLPSKLIDYIGSETNIIAITPKDSPTYRTLVKVSARPFTYEQIDELADYLAELMASPGSWYINTEQAEQYNVVNQTKRYIEVFESVIEE